MAKYSNIKYLQLIKHIAKTMGKTNDAKKELVERDEKLNGIFYFEYKY